MSHTQGTLVVTLLGAIVVLLGITLLLSLLETALPQWEYRMVSVKDLAFRETLDKLGAEGWELAFARRVVSQDGWGQAEGIYECIMKREKRPLPVWRTPRD
jgi:hypothetical protein